MPPAKKIPDRKMPESAVDETAPVQHVLSEGRNVAFAEDAPAAAPEPAPASSTQPGQTKGVAFAEDAPAAAPEATSASSGASQQSSTASQQTKAGRVHFGAVDFAKEKDDKGRDEILSPTDLQH